MKINQQDESSFTSSNEMSLRDLISSLIILVEYLKKKWLIIFSFSFFLALLIGGYAFFQKAKYVASLSFVLEEEKGATGGGLSSIASQFGIDMGSSSSGVFSQANVIELIKSRELIESTLLKKISYKGRLTTLADIYIDSVDVENNTEIVMPHNYSINQPSKEQLEWGQHSLLGMMYKFILSNLSVSPKDKKTSIIVIEFKSTNETFSKLFVDNLAESVSDFYIKMKSQKSQINVEILQKQADSLRASLNSAISGVAATAEKTFNVNPALSLIKAPSIQRQIDVQTNSAMLAQVLGSLEMAKISLRKETPLFFLLDKPVFPLLKEKPSTIKYFILTGLIASFFISFVLCLILFLNPKK